LPAIRIGNLVVFLRGGWEVTAVTLSRFFALHVLVLPAVIILFLVAHFFMIRRQGIARPL
jgi:quinol-cytochrome oxidoreductase complex cytochrome b subunit